jgi:NAD(P)-dependent dehydrogenase (short-subunit alcohol dehydrogenase family)
MHTAIITGVSRGLGEAIAARLLALQWMVVGIGRTSGGAASRRALSLRQS